MLTPVGEIQAATRTREEQREFERERVAEHYEHSPDVFSMVLDSALTYSTGIYRNPDEGLETAQHRKFEYVRQLLEISVPANACWTWAVDGGATCSISPRIRKGPSRGLR
jgi:hypothetical protein